MNGDECGKTDGLRGDNASGRNKADRALGRYDTGNDNYCFSDGLENIPGHVCAVLFYPLTRFGRVQEETRCMMCVTVPILENSLPMELMAPSGWRDRPVDSERDHVLGPSDTEITLVEYGSYVCPALQGGQ